MIQGADSEGHTSDSKVEFFTIESRRKAFGELLSTLRQRGNCSVKSLAQSTRIAEAFIEALEAGELHKLPGTVYGRGFVRNISVSLSGDTKELLKHYDLCWEPTGKVVRLSPVRGSDILQERPRNGQLRLGSWARTIDPVAVVGGVFLVALLGGGTIYWFSQGPSSGPDLTATDGVGDTAETTSPSSPDVAPAEAASVPPASVATGSMTVPAPGGQPVEGSKSAATAAATGLRPMPSQGKEPSPPPPMVSTLTTPVPAGQIPAASPPIKGKEVLPLPLPLPLAANSPEVITMFGDGVASQIVDIRVRTPVKIRMKLDDGAYETLDLVPREYRYHFEKHADFVIFDASAADIQFNGKPVGAQGTKDRIRRLSFLADGESVPF